MGWLGDNLIGLAASTARATDAVLGVVTKPLKDGMDTLADGLDGLRDEEDD